MKDFKVVNTTFRNNAGPGMGIDAGYGFGAIGALSSVFGSGGTGGCEGLDAPKNGNKSIGQPLCEYHEDPFKSSFGSDEAPLGKGNMFGSELGESFGAGGLGLKGTGAGGGGSGGSIGLGNVGGLGHGGGGTGSGYGAGGGTGTKGKAAGAPKPSSSSAP